MTHLSIFIDEASLLRFKAAVGSRGMSKTIIEFIHNYSAEIGQQEDELKDKFRQLEAEKLKRDAIYESVKAALEAAEQKKAAADRAKLEHMSDLKYRTMKNRLDKVGR
jgi:hypothetical protein